MVRRSSLVLLVTLALSVPATKAGASEVVVGVAVHVAVNVDEAQQKETAERTARALRDVTGVKAVVHDGPVDQACPFTGRCVQTTAEALNATQLVFLSLVRVGDRVQMDVSWADVATGATAARGAIGFNPSNPKLDAQFDAAAATWIEAPAAPAKEETPMPDVGAETQPAKKSTLGWPVWVAGGVGAALLVSGIGVGVSAKSQENRLIDEGCLQTACDPDRINSIKTRAAVADVLYVGAGLSVATAIVFALLAEDEEPTSSIGVQLGDSGGTLTFGGRF